MAGGGLWLRPGLHLGQVACRSLPLRERAVELVVDLEDQGHGCAAHVQVYEPLPTWGLRSVRLLLRGAFQACTQGLHLIGVGACAAQHYHPLPVMLSNTLKACCCRLCWQASTP